MSDTPAKPTDEVDDHLAAYIAACLTKADRAWSTPAERAEGIADEIRRLWNSEEITEDDMLVPHECTVCAFRIDGRTDDMDIIRDGDGFAHRSCIEGYNAPYMHVS